MFALTSSDQHVIVVANLNRRAEIVSRSQTDVVGCCRAIAAAGCVFLRRLEMQCPGGTALRSPLLSAWGDCADLVDFVGLADAEMIARSCVPGRCSSCDAVVVAWIGWGEEMRQALLRHQTARIVPLACGPKIKTSRRLARATVKTPPANALFFQEPKTLAKQHEDSYKLSNDRWMAPSFPQFPVPVSRFPVSFRCPSGGLC